MKKLLFALLFAAVALPAAAQTTGAGSPSSGAGISTVTSLPTCNSSKRNLIVVVTDDSAIGACDSAAGSAATLCRCTGSAWTKLGDGSNTGASTPAGSTTQFQYNSAGAMAGATGVTFTGAGVMTLGVNTTTLGKVKMFGNTSGDVTIQPNAIAGAGIVLTLPATTDTLVGKTTTDTLTNKTLVAPALGTIASGNLAAGTGYTLANLAGLGTGVGTALAVNTGSAGAPVLFNGAYGTPTSLVGTNITGTASSFTVGVATNTAAKSGNTATYVTTTGTLTNGDCVKIDANGNFIANGSACGGGGGSGDVTSNTASSVDSELALFSSTTGKVIKRATTSGVLKGTSGVLGTAAAGDIYGLWSGTCSSATFLRGDGSCAAPSGAGTVTNTGGSLTANAVMLGAGTTDSKVIVGITTDGTSILNLGVANTVAGKVKLFGGTSGDVTLQSLAAAGTATTATFPATSTTIPIISQGLTISGPSTARTITVPDANFTVARTDAANTFTGHQTIEGVTATGATGTANMVFSATPTFTGSPVLSTATATSLAVTGSSAPANGIYLSTTNTVSLSANTTQAFKCTSTDCTALGTLTATGNLTAPNLAPLSGSLVSGGLIWTDGTNISSSAALTANLPVFGGGAGATPFSGTRSGNTTKVATTTGSLTSGNCAQWDTNGNVIDAGAACGGSGSTGANPSASAGLTAVNGVATTYLRSDGAPAIAQNIVPTWTGIHTFTPAARSSGAVPFFVITTPADTGQTTTTESIGLSKTAATRAWATGAVTLQREVVLGAPTYAAAGSSTFSTVINLDVPDPIAGTNVTISNPFSIRAANVLFTGIIKAGSTPVALTNSAGKLLTAALAAPSGTGANVATSTGALTNGNCVSINATGDFVDNGAVCGGSGSTGANPTGTIGLSAVNGVATSYLRSDGAPALSQAIVPTWTGVHTFTPTARSSGAAAFFTITSPTDTGQTASTESIGVNKTASTRTWATGALTTQREVVFGAPTYAFAGSSTLATAVNVDIADPIQGTNATLTNKYGLRFVNGQGTTSLKLGVAGTTAGSLVFENATSGTITYTAPTGGLGTITRTLQAVSGTETVRIAAGTSALATGAISSGVCATVVTTTATGTATTDVINWGFNGDPTAVTGYSPTANGMLTIIAYPSSGNVNYKVCNNTASSITPGAITLNWIVVR